MIILGKAVFSCYHRIFLCGLWRSDQCRNHQSWSLLNVKDGIHYQREEYLRVHQLRQDLQEQNYLLDQFLLNVHCQNLYQIMLTLVNEFFSYYLHICLCGLCGSGQYRNHLCWSLLCAKHGNHFQFLAYLQEHQLHQDLRQPSNHLEQFLQYDHDGNHYQILVHYQFMHIYLCSLCGRSQCSNHLGSILRYEEECDRFLRAWCLLEHQLH